MFGLFDRPATWECLTHLTSVLPLRGFQFLAGLADDALLGTLGRLQQWGLLSRGETPKSPPAPDTLLDTHPLIREYFGDRFRHTKPDGWHDAHQRLYRFFTSHAPLTPETADHVQVLLRAVSHACKGGSYSSALHQVYYPRIMRGKANFASAQLGLLQPLLSALYHFCEAGDWARPVSYSPEQPEGLHVGDQLYVLSQIGFLLAATRGYASPEVGRIYERRERLAAESTDPSEQFGIDYGLWRYHVASCRPNGRKARASRAGLLRHATDSNGPELAPACAANPPRWRPPFSGWGASRTPPNAPTAR